MVYYDFYLTYVSYTLVSFFFLFKLLFHNIIENLTSKHFLLLKREKSFAVVKSKLDDSYLPYNFSHCKFFSKNLPRNLKIGWYLKKEKKEKKCSKCKRI